MEHRPNGLFLWQKVWVRLLPLYFWLLALLTKYNYNGCWQILSVTVRVIQRDTEDKKGFFNPRPYFRLFINWLFDLVMQDHILNGANFQVFFLDEFITIICLHELIWVINFQVLIGFANAFHALQPLKVPAFRLASQNSELQLLLRNFVLNSHSGFSSFRNDHKFEYFVLIHCLAAGCFSYNLNYHQLKMSQIYFCMSIISMFALFFICYYSFLLASWTIGQACCL